jgi:hypothetical protein
MKKYFLDVEHINQKPFVLSLVGLDGDSFSRVFEVKPESESEEMYLDIVLSNYKGPFYTKEEVVQDFKEFWRKSDKMYVLNQLYGLYCAEQYVVLNKLVNGYYIPKYINEMAKDVEAVYVLSEYSSEFCGGDPTFIIHELITEQRKDFPRKDLKDFLLGRAKWLRDVYVWMEKRNPAAEKPQ